MLWLEVAISVDGFEGINSSVGGRSVQEEESVVSSFVELLVVSIRDLNEISVEVPGDYGSREGTDLGGEPSWFADGDSLFIAKDGIDII